MKKHEQQERIFVCKSEDGVDLYEGDVFTVVWKTLNMWVILGDFSFGVNLKLKEIAANDRVFSTKDAAEKWVAEQNKPKDTVVYFDQNHTPNNALIHIDGVHLRNGDALRFCLSGDELEKIYEAYKSLQS